MTNKALRYFMKTFDRESLKLARADAVNRIHYNGGTTPGYVERQQQIIKSIDAELRRRNIQYK